MSKLKESLDHIPSAVKVTGDGASIGIVMGSMVEILPAVSAALAIVWTCIRIYETDTVQGWLKRRKEKKKK